MRIGLISDTHGMLRGEVFSAFKGVERILHAGDIGSPSLLVELGAVAPVLAVWGNTDGFDVRSEVGEIVDTELAGYRVVVAHGHQLGSPKPDGLRAAYPAADIIVYGHTHRPLVEYGPPLVVNPGAAGATRFGIPPSVAVLTLGAKPEVELLELPQ
ncbi:MAG TPA: metallophosphoesterase family protein [Longimicrobiales bacterium]|nr:metallophosphoesterase family protein [Longimicrobiales bacterium]